MKLVSLYWTRNRPCIGQGIVQKVSEKLTFPSTFVEKKKTLSLLKRALSSMAASPVLYGEYRALHYANEVENSKVQGFAFQHLANEFKKKTLVEYYASQFCSEEMNHDKILANFPQAILLKLEFLNIFFKTEQVPGKKLVSFIISEYIFGAVDIAAIFYVLNSGIEKFSEDFQEKIRKIQNNRNKLLIECGRMYMELQEIDKLSQSTIEQLVIFGLVCEEQHVMEYYPEEEGFSKKVGNERPISKYLTSLAKNIYDTLLPVACGEVIFNEPTHFFNK